MVKSLTEQASNDELTLLYKNLANARKIFEEDRKLDLGFIETIEYFEESIEHYEGMIAQIKTFLEKNQDLDPDSLQFFQHQLNVFYKSIIEDFNFEIKEFKEGITSHLKYEEVERIETQIKLYQEQQPVSSFDDGLEPQFDPFEGFDLLFKEGSLSLLTTDPDVLSGPLAGLNLLEEEPNKDFESIPNIALSLENKSDGSFKAFSVLEYSESFEGFVFSDFLILSILGFCIFSFFSKNFEKKAEK